MLLRKATRHLCCLLIPHTASIFHSGMWRQPVARPQPLSGSVFRMSVISFCLGSPQKHCAWGGGVTHRLELVAEVDLGGQDLEQHHDLLVKALSVLCHQRQDLHGRQLPPVVPCARQRGTVTLRTQPLLEARPSCGRQAAPGSTDPAQMPRPLLDGAQSCRDGPQGVPPQSLASVLDGTASSLWDCTLHGRATRHPRDVLLST